MNRLLFIDTTQSEQYRCDQDDKIYLKFELKFLHTYTFMRRFVDASLQRFYLIMFRSERNG
jgi:hypothetical protein